MFKKLVLMLCFLGLAGGKASAAMSDETQYKLREGFKWSARILLPVGMGANLFGLLTENKYSFIAAMAGSALYMSGVFLNTGKVFLTKYE